MSLILKHDDPIVIMSDNIANQIKKLYANIKIHTRLDIGHCVLVFPDFCIKCVLNRDNIMIHYPPLKRINNFDLDTGITNAINEIIGCIENNMPFDSNYYYNYLYII